MDEWSLLVSLSLPLFLRFSPLPKVSLGRDLSSSSLIASSAFSSRRFEFDGKSPRTRVMASNMSTMTMMWDDDDDNGTAVANADEPNDCGVLGFEQFEKIQSCGFWVEGISMSILGLVALITNFISIFAFTRFVKHRFVCNICSPVSNGILWSRNNFNLNNLLKMDWLNAEGYVCMSFVRNVLSNTCMQIIFWRPRKCRVLKSIHSSSYSEVS